MSLIQIKMRLIILHICCDSVLKLSKFRESNKHLNATKLKGLF